VTASLAAFTAGDYACDVGDDNRHVSLEPDPVIEVYKRDIDRTLLRRNLQKTVEQRFIDAMQLQRWADELRRAGESSESEGEQMTDFAALLRVLVSGGVEFILVGGAAAVAHGSSRLTQDLDVVYRRTPENVRRLTAALAPHAPYLRGAPEGLPFHFDEATVRRGLNFTLTTSLGDLDVLGEIVGGGGFEQLAPDAIPLEVFGVQCLCLDLEQLIRVKRAAGRPKDLEAIAELEALLEERQR
jgi:hypothetical protein